MVKVTVTWNKEVFKDVEVDTHQPPVTFKTQLFSLTGVPPERQKIMGVKGGLLKDDADWAKLGLKNGQKLMLMGSAETVPEAPAAPLTFVEDLPEEEQDVEGFSKYGAGLKNAGNTCYMNSSLQCLYRVPELRRALQLYQAAGNVPMIQEDSHKLTAAAKELFAELDRSAAPVLPLRFLVQLRASFPQFAEMTTTGMYKQQDAEECWTQLLYSLRERLQGGEADNPVHALFGISLHTKLTCQETGEQISEDGDAYALKCNISIDINLLHQGLALALKDDREKTSSITGQLAKFEGTSAITKLPVYLTVQMMRFYYKVDVRQKAKILRKVAFPMLLDCYEFCSAEYKQQLDGPRDALLAIEERQATARRAGGKSENAVAKTAEAAPEAPASSNGAANHPSGSDTPMPDASAPAANGSTAQAYTGQKTGRYDLVAVLTHKGRSADSGHYVSWVKEEDGQWINFDDENIIPVKEADVLSLAGGGDWHMANLLLYKAQVVPPE